MRKWHNLLRQQYTFLLYLQDSLSTVLPRSFPTQITHHVVLITAFLATSFERMNITQFFQPKDNEDNFIVFTSAIWFRGTSTKTEKGSVQSIVETPQSINIWLTEALDGRLCVQDNIIDYMRTTNSIHSATYRFFNLTTVQNLHLFIIYSPFSKLRRNILWTFL